MKLLNLLAKLCIICFVIGGFSVIYLMFSIWYSEKEMVLTAVGFLVAGFIFWRLTNNREKIVMKRQKKEEEEYRQKYLEENKQE